MDEKKLKDLYSEEVNNSAPNMDALWNKIEAQLPDKQTSFPQHSTKKPFITLRKGLVCAAACVGLLVVIPSAINNAGTFSQNDLAEFDASNDNTPSYDAPEETLATTTYVTTNNGIEKENSILSYDDLNLAPSYESYVQFDAEPYGDNYFVEDNVLVDTECFVDAIVDRVYASEDNKCVYYELTTINVYSDELDFDSNIIVSSCSEYFLKIDREYILPLKIVDGEFHTVYDNAPQIEITLDDGMVFHNGWKSLETEQTQDILYTQNSVDDFFYDRMKFSYANDISSLIEKWYNIKNDNL